jgi:uncharacterized membrane-anchored protein
MNELELNLWMSARADDPEIPEWKALDIVTRKWAVLSGMEKDLSDYQKRKEMFE